VSKETEIVWEKKRDYRMTAAIWERSQLMAFTSAPVNKVCKPVKNAEMETTGTRTLFKWLREREVDRVPRHRRVEMEGCRTYRSVDEIMSMDGVFPLSSSPMQPKWS
jgi:hypothetical protein